MTDPRDPFERHLADELRVLADGEVAPASIAATAEQRAEGLDRQRRRRRLAAGGTTALLGAAAVWLLVVAVFAADGDDRTDELRTADASTTTTRVESTSTSSSSSTTVPDPVGPSGSRPTTTTQPEPAPEPKCLEVTGAPNNYMQPGYEGFIENYYTTYPEVDRPASIRVCVDDISPKVGQTVRVTVHGEDPDATTFEDECGAGVNWDIRAGPSSPPIETCSSLGNGGPNGPAPPPGPGASTDRTATHEYTQVGDVTLSGWVNSGRFNTGRPDPYSSRVAADLTLTVHQ